MKSDDLSSARREMLQLRIKQAHGELGDTSQFKKLRKKIARLLTSKRG